MKKLLINSIFLVLFSQFVFAQDVITVESKGNDISDNLDLEAVASVFGESLNLEDFEKRLNDPEAQISNLDLNGDGYVDYLRVVENSQEQTILISIQAVLGQDLFQDVATIDVEKDKYGETRVQVVGDVYMYGVDYIIEPVYVRTPAVCTYFWGVHYHPYYSPYYWHYYPTYYHSWHPYHPHVYRTNVHVHVNRSHTYHYTADRRSTRAVYLNNTTRRNDYGKSNPDKSFASRNGKVKNTHELNRQRGTVSNTSSTKSTRANTVSATNNTRTVNSSSTTGVQSNGRRVQSEWNGSTKSTSRSPQVKSNRSSSSREASTSQTQYKSSNNRSVQSKSSVSRSNSSSQNKSVKSNSSVNKSSSNSSRSKSVQSKSSSSRPTKAKPSSKSSSNNKSTSRSNGGSSSGNKTGNSNSGSSNGRSKKR